MLEQLYSWSNINSFSSSLTGLRAMRRILHEAFLPIADRIESIPMAPIKTYGDLLFIQKRPELKKRVLLCGHMDTVYAPDNPFQACRTLDANRINGPGVADMKGGLVVILHALKAFEQTSNAKELGWDVLINADEELGSPASAP
ncbi:MAG: carboxypeptidase, partial [Legionella sp. 21-45-4]